MSLILKLGSENNMKKITFFVVALGILLASSQVFAATYKYIDVNGEEKLETAVTPNEAIRTALNRDPESGVILVTDMEEAVEIASTVDRDTEVYAYVAVDGEVAVHTAETPTEAINTAPEIKSDSGVMLVAR